MQKFQNAKATDRLPAAFTKTYEPRQISVFRLSR